MTVIPKQLIGGFEYAKRKSRLPRIHLGNDRHGLIDLSVPKSTDYISGVHSFGCMYRSVRILIQVIEDADKLGLATPICWGELHDGGVLFFIVWYIELTL